MRGRFGNTWIDTPKSGDEFEVFQRRQLVIDHRLIRHPCHHLLGRGGVRECVDPVHRYCSGIGRQQPGDHAERRGFAGTVGAHQHIEFARSHRKIERVHREAVKTLR